MRARDERGSTLVLFALTAVALFTFTALAVDLGGAVNQRRQDQSGADAAALGAAQNMPKDSAAVTAARNLVRDTLGLTAAQLPDAAFDTCAWDTHLTVTAAGANCISFDNARSRIRVRVPKRAYETAFGGVVGRKTIVHSAAAEAQLKVRGLGNLLPLATVATSGATCLKDGGGDKLPPPCNGPDTGNFGTLSSPLIGSMAFGTTTSCPGSPGNHDLENNIAVGIDHRVVKFSGVNDYYDVCGQIDPSPNNVMVKTGFISGVFENGMVTGISYSDGGPARLQRGPFAKRRVMGVLLDNWPLWKFIPPAYDGSASVPASCWPSEFAGAAYTQLRTCLADYAAQPAGTYQPLFALDTDDNDGIYDIQKSPRFAFVPRVSDLPTGASESRRILRFQPVWIQSLYGGCKPNGGGCDFVFEPDATSTAELTSNQINGMQALVLTGTLPGRLNDDPFSIDENLFIQLVK